MTAEEEIRMQNQTWLSKLRDVLHDYENPINDTERDKAVEEVYQLTLREFKCKGAT